MAGIDAKLKSAFAKTRASNFQTFSGTVTGVNEGERTIDITDVNDFPLYDIRLTAMQGSTGDHVMVIPKIGSSVLVSMIGNDQNTLFVSMVNEPEKIAGAIGTSSFEVDKAGYLIKRGDENLKKVLNDYIDEVNKIIVVNGTTINVTATTLIKNRLNNILK